MRIFNFNETQTRTRIILLDVVLGTYKETIHDNIICVSPDNGDLCVDCKRHLVSLFNDARARDNISSVHNHEMLTASMRPRYKFANSISAACVVIRGASDEPDEDESYVDPYIDPYVVLSNFLPREVSRYYVSTGALPPDAFGSGTQMLFGILTECRNELRPNEAQPIRLHYVPMSKNVITLTAMSTMAMMKAIEFSRRRK